MKQYKAKNGNIQYKPSLDQLIHACETDTNSGFCLACGEEAYNIEPDARRYTCECCSMPKVYGCQELLFMGLHHSD